VELVFRWHRHPHLPLPKEAPIVHAPIGLFIVGLLAFALRRRGWSWRGAGWRPLPITAVNFLTGINCPGWPASAD